MLGTSRTPMNVFTQTGKNVPQVIRAILGVSPRPNQTMANGTKAIDGIDLRL